MKINDDDRVLSTGLPYSASGALVSASTRPFVPRLPSTWPVIGPDPDPFFVDILEHLFLDGMLAELTNVCNDILTNNPTGLQGRGHVVGVSMMSILDSVSQFASDGQRQCIRIPEYIERYFPPEYNAIRQDVSDLYRNGLIHEWFMRKVAFLPGNEPLMVQKNGSPVLGLLTFRDALRGSIQRFLEDLRADGAKRKIAAARYRLLQQDIRD